MLTFNLYNNFKKLMSLRLFRLSAYLFFFVILVLFSNAYAQPALLLKEKLLNASPGQYIVTEQDKNYSVLSIRSRSNPILVLEELTIPVHQFKILNTNWKNWVKDNAPGHTSWTLYEIDLEKNCLNESYSISRGGWLFINDSKNFFTQLLALPLEKTADIQKRRIGPPPLNGETDHRRIWAPALVIEGKKRSKPVFDVWHGRWPKDEGPISECKLELYFSGEKDTFPFPYWIEVYNGHYNYKIRIVDSGFDLLSPFKEAMPHRSLQFIKKIQKNDDNIFLTLKVPSYYKKINLFAIDISDKKAYPLLIPFVMKTGIESEQVILEIARKNLEVFQNNHRYQWMAVPEENSAAYAETSDYLLWTIKN